jgi:hypothetical protein
VQDSASSNFIQMADVIAHSLFQHLVLNQEKRALWNWYPAYIHKIERECVCRPE